MAEYMFGVTREKLSKRECARRDRICVAEGGTGFIYCENLPGIGRQGWFTGPNRGFPFDRDPERRVLAAVRDGAS